MRSSPHPRPKHRRPPIGLLYLLLVVPLGFLVVFNYIPALSALYHAFTQWDVGAKSAWTGLANFRGLFSDLVFLKSVINVVKLGAFVLLMLLTVPFIVAEMIFHLKSERSRYLCRVAVVLPMIVPGVVLMLLWRYMYSDIGIVTEFLNSVGLKTWVRGWLSNPRTALWAVACVGFPFASGFHILIYYAGLSNISSSILEAAQLDGLGSFRQIIYIHVPLIRQQLRLLLVVTMTSVVNGFESIYILTGDGGPGYETMVPGLYMFLNGFAFQRMGYACALGLLMLIFLLSFTIGVNRIMRTDSD